MNCNTCGLDSEKVKSQIKGNVNKYNVPFVCPACGGVNFPLQAVRDIVFIYPLYVRRSRSLIIIPDSVQSNIERDCGMVLTVGPGYLRNGKIFIKPEIEVGDIVVYDKGIPWRYDVEGTDNKSYRIPYMGYQDIKGVSRGENMEIEPLADRIIVKQLTPETQSRGGIALPESIQQEQPKGKVISVGKGRLLDDGTISSMSVKVGDTVVFSKNSFNSITNKDGEKLLILHEVDVLAIIDREDLSE